MIELLFVASINLSQGMMNNKKLLTLTIILSETLAQTKYSLFFECAQTATTSKKYLWI